MASTVDHLKTRAVTSGRFLVWLFRHIFIKRFMQSSPFLCAALILLGGGWCTAAPTVTVTVPTPGTTVSILTSVSITFSEPVTGVAATDLGVNGEQADAVTGAGAGPYVFNFPQPAPGSVAVGWNVDPGIAGLGTGDFVPGGAWSYTLTDTLPPELAKRRTTVPGQEMDDLRPAPGAVAGVLTSAVVMFNESVTGVDAADFRINGTPAGSVLGDSAGPYVFTFASPPDGAVAFTWTTSHGIVDLAGNGFGGVGWNMTKAASAGQVVITEFLASNGGSVVATGSDADGTRDENWDLSSWLELHNPGAADVNLKGWSLTNDVAEPAQWVFPNRVLAAGARLVVWASEKDRKPVTGNLHTNFALNANGGTLALFSPDSPSGAAASAWADYPAQRYDYSYGAQSTDGLPRYFRPATVSQGNYTPPSSDFGAPAPTVPPAVVGLVNGTSTLTGVTPDPSASVGRGIFSTPFSVILSGPQAGAVIRYTLDGSVPLVSSPAYTAALPVSATTVLRFAAFGADQVPSRTITHSYLFPDTVVNQPSPPYNNPAITTDEGNPVPPAPGGSPLPIAWGSNGTFTAAQTLTGFPTGTAPPAGTTGTANNLTAGQIPADYGMDPKIYADPAKYNDAGAVDAVNGKTNLQRIRTALRSLPALSLVIKSGDMFGAYPNGTTPSGTIDPLYPTSSSGVKRDMTKPCSLELLQPDGTTVFVVDAGVDLHGNASRDSFKNPKHGFTIRFKGKYGAGKLQAKLYPDSPVREWDKLILRGDFNSSWLHQNGNDSLGSGDDSSQRPRGTRIREAYCKEAFRDMGGAASHHRFCNLFINGIFWGNYELMEDQAQDFGASYFGGQKDDYDVIDQGKLKSGSWSVWSSMKSLLGWTGGTPTTDPANPPSSDTFLAAFTPAQYENLRGFLDLPWFLDYMIHHLYFGHRDWATSAGDASQYMKNVYFLRAKNGTFKAMPWDLENLMWHQDEDRVTGMTTFSGGVPSLFPPCAIHPRVRNNSQYRQEFADRAWRHMVRIGGALTPPVMAARLDKWTAINNQDSLCLESARWGDYRYKVHPYTLGTTTQVYTWNGAWYDGTGPGYAAGAWTGGSQRFNTGHLLGNLGTWNASMANAWYDEVRRLKAVYYPVRTNNVLAQFRTNGLYPLLNAPELRNNATDVVLGDAILPPGTLVKLVLPAATANTSSFGDIYYTTDGSDPRPAYDTTGTPRPAASLYSTPFAVPGPVVVKARALAKTSNFPQKSAVRAASPGVNVTGTYTSTGGTSGRGQIIAAPLALDGLTLAAGDRILLKNQSTAAANGIWSVSIPGTGLNGVWDRAADWDADGEVAGGTWVRVTAGTQNQATAWRVTNTAGIAVGGSAGSAIVFSTQAFSPWSALLELTLLTGPTLATVSIAEVNYNPRNSQGGSAAEFIEFLNYGTLPVTMSNWSMDGVDYIFPAGFVLQPGNRIVIASSENPARFALQYPGVTPLGYFGGSLSNGGERLSLLDGRQNIVCSVEYDDAAPWPTTPDNGGYALEIIDPAGDLQSPANWRASLAPGGTPGIAGAVPAAPVILLSEFSARFSGTGPLGGLASDFVELRNAEPGSVNLSGWSVRASPGDLLAVLPAGTGIAPGGLLTIPAAPGLAAPSLAGGLEDNYGEIQLFNATGQLQDGVRYGPQATNLSFSRVSGTWQLGLPTPNASASLITNFAPPGSLLLNEWLPNPRPGDPDFLELRNLDTEFPFLLTGCSLEVNGALFSITVPSAMARDSLALLRCDPGSTRGSSILLSLPASGGTVRFLGSNGQPLDSITYPAAATQVSGGRLYDSPSIISQSLVPSPDFDNYSLPAAGVHLSEVLVLNQTGATAPWARRPAWIELANTPATATESLTGWKLRTIGTSPATWTIPPGVGLTPGARLLLWCDPAYAASTANGASLNTALNLNPAQTWGLELLQPAGYLYQSLTWGRQLTDKSFGFTGSVYTLLAAPTPGIPNAPAATLDSPALARLNEWYGGDSVTPGNFLEIYHPGPNALDLGGLWLGDSPADADQRRWQIPGLSFLDPRTHALYTAAGPAGRPNVLGFDIARGGEYLRLSSNDGPGTLIDEQNFPGFPSLVSQGRLTDGTANLTVMNPTPGFANAALGGQLITEHPQSLVTSGGSPAAFAIAAPGAASWQWKFNGSSIAGANAATYSVNPWATPSNAGAYTCVVTGPGGTAISNAATLTVLNNFSTYAQIFGLPANPAMDSDGDGTGNGLEFLAGTNPLTATNPAPAIPVLSTSPGVISLGYDLQLDPNAVYGAVLGDLSPNLSLWSTRTADSITPISGGARFLWNLPAATTPRHFLRLNLIP